MTEQVGEAVPASQRGSWTSFLKSIASFSGDLSSMTAPPFILSPVSLTEFPAYWCERPELFAAIADAKSDEDRALAVLKWFISTLKGQYTSRNDTMGSEKKPLNPVLGELFYGMWPDKGGRGQTDLLVEQVSHHPPITAYVIENKAKGLKLVGHNAQKTSFSGGSIIVKQIGHAILTVKNLSASSASGAPPVTEYLITLPRLRIDGLWYGSPYIELCETSYIVGGGFVSTVEYKGKGYFSGKSHSFKATVSPAPGAPGREHVVEGLWHTTSKFVKGGVSGKGDFHDVNGPKEEVTVVAGGGDGAPEGEMGEFETRKLWRLVAKGIREGDFESASREKGRIENEQRQRRRDEVAAGTSWALKHFTPIASDPVYERLGALAKIQPPTEDAYVFLDNWPKTAPVSGA
ncbi:Oxysterol binding protein [Pleurotus ostreatus]|uniref:Oxysterol binding protein n=1 Tax=Pleurotus ostreatus TaxID=5322 RepID=A0A8H6ZJ48_PLEOS|nr:Oxysterol binding protein [Pleurotus ostreatus]KAF7421069.1 Oxysterol binding protein [Pleurotus ostreatus]KAJ8690582.1 Oxysterol-binding protein 4 [Pleurotus ostreatus]